MLIFIKGTDSFLAREAINKLKQKYLEKNPDGTELIEIDCEERKEPNPRTKLSGETASGLLSHGAVGAGHGWADLQAVPLFATSRLIIIKRAGELLVAEQDNLASMLTDLPPSSVVVIWDAKPFKANSPLCVILSGTANSTADTPQPITHKAAKTILAEPLVGSGLKNWIKIQATEIGFEITPESVNELVDQYGSDLWAIQTDLKTRQGTSSISSWGRAQTEKPFILFDYVRGQKWPELKKHLIASHQRGDAVEMTIGGLAAAIRKNISHQDLKRTMIDALSSIDIALKSGLIEAGDAVALLACYLPSTPSTTLGVKDSTLLDASQKRVQWEVTWEQLT